MAPAGPLYSTRAVEAALEMAGAALACKNAALDELLCLAALQQPAALPVACGEGDEGEAAPLRAQATAGDSTQQPAAELGAVRQRLAAAEGLLAAERSQRLAVKSQLEAVKRQLAEAVAAQGHAAFELGELEGLIQELRAENQQLQATLTQRESAYLTLLETVQQLFVEHSPVGSGGGSSPAKLAERRAGEQQDGDMGAGLQHKLWEWQQRLERAAHLRSAERGSQQCNAVSSGAAVAAAAGATGCMGGFDHSQPVAPPDSPVSSGGSFVSASPQTGSLQAAIEAAAASSVCTDDAVSASSSPSGATAGSACSGRSAAAGSVPAAAGADASPTSGPTGLQPGSPRILAARPGAAGQLAGAAGQLANADTRQAAAANAGAPSEAAAVGVTPRSKAALSGSRIKALGLKAALSPAHKQQPAAGREAQ